MLIRRIRTKVAASQNLEFTWKELFRNAFSHFNKQLDETLPRCGIKGNYNSKKLEVGELSLTLRNGTKRSLSSFSKIFQREDSAVIVDLADQTV